MMSHTSSSGRITTSADTRKNTLVTRVLLTILASSLILALVSSNLTAGNDPPTEGPYIKITVDSENRTRYGFVYPLTHVFSIPSDASALKVWLRYSQVEPWTQLQEKTSNDLFNGIYAVRFDYTNDRVYVSVGFNGTGNAIHLRFTDLSDNTVYDVSHLGITEYYDDRKCVVTVTLDDWDAERSSYFIRAINLFQEREMWVTPGMVTWGMSLLGESFNATTWMEVQNETDEGYVEPASHSRTHPHPPYSNTTWEVKGSRYDIIGNLTYVPYSWGSNQYVYTWIEPFGEWDDTIRTEVGQSDYIVDREFLHTSDVSWGEYNPGLGIYVASHYPDPGGRWDGTGAIDSKFDQAYNNGHIYHGMFHPAGTADTRLTEEQWQDITDHLDYISGRKDVWYVGFGHLYMYHYLQEFSSELLSIDTVGFFTDTSDSDFQQGTLNNTEIVNGSLRLKLTGVPDSFGKTDVGALTFTAYDDMMTGCKYDLPNAGDAESITVYLTGPTGKYRTTSCAIYSDNNGAPNALMGTTESKRPSSGWTTFDFSPPLTLPSGTYWLCFYISLYDETGYYSIGSTNQACSYYRIYDGTWPDPFPTPTYSNQAINIYANFTGSGVGNGGNGSWTSKWHDAGRIVNWTRILWSETTPPGNDIVISTRTSPEMFEGYPDESKASPWSENLTDPTGSVITNPDNRFLQYKVYLLTDGSDTPILHSATVLYENSSEPQPTYATLTVDSTPVKGECFVNSTPLGIAPQTRSVVAGTYVVSWGDVGGYYTPSSQLVTLAENETMTVVGVYEEILPPSQYQLSIYSEPINGFTVEISNSTDTFQMKTGSSIVLTEGEYNVTIIDTIVEITFQQWIFDSWSDGNSNVSRTIDLSKDTVLLYEYVRALFSDNFDDNSSDLSRWILFEKGNGTVTETNQRVECNVPSGTGTAGYITKSSYDLSSCDIWIDVSNEYLCEAALAITLDGVYDHFWYSNNFYVVEKHRAPCITEGLFDPNITLVKRRVNGGERILLYNGTWTGPNGLLRIRIHDGVIYFYEEDNLLYSEAYQLDSYYGYIHFEANTWNPPEPGYHGTDYFDNFVFTNS